MGKKSKSRGVPKRSLATITYLGAHPIDMDDGMGGDPTVMAYRVRFDVTESPGEYIESVELHRSQGGTTVWVDLMYAIGGTANTTIYEAYDWSPPTGGGPFRYEAHAWVVKYTKVVGAGTNLP